MAKTDSYSHSSLSSLLRDHKKQLLSRDKLLLGSCDAQAESAPHDFQELNEQELWDLDQQGSYPRQEESYDSYLLRQHHYQKSTKINIPQQQQQGKVLHRQQSAPMNVPDWSKILGSSANSKHTGNGFFDYDDEDDDSYEQRIPPHEVVARDYTRSHVMTFSVRETLKGRDVSRVRNAVLKQTGFL